MPGSKGMQGTGGWQEVREAPGTAPLSSPRWAQTLSPFHHTGRALHPVLGMAGAKGEMLRALHNGHPNDPPWTCC